MKKLLLFLVSIICFTALPALAGDVKLMTAAEAARLITKLLGLRPTPAQHDPAIRVPSAIRAVLSVFRRDRARARGSRAGGRTRARGSLRAEFLF